MALSQQRFQFEAVSLISDCSSQKFVWRFVSSTDQMAFQSGTKLVSETPSFPRFRNFWDVNVDCVQSTGGP
jgi:hypothetical protein